MKSTRIIARLDIKGSALVKGIHLEGLRALGRPEDFASHYYSQGADELIFQDTVASLYQRSSLLDLISRTAQSVFIPITVGGGIRTLADINSVLRAGADRVAINTAALNNPELINEASRTFGSSTIVVAVEVIRQTNGSYLAFTDNGREDTGVELIHWLKEVEDRGAGEILLTSIDRDGTGRGFDIELVGIAANLISIPVIAHGGAGKPSHIYDVITQAKPDAVAIAAMVHYDTIKQISNGDRTVEGNTEFISKEMVTNLYEPHSIPTIKQHLIDEGISIRPYVGW